MIVAVFDTRDDLVKEVARFIGGEAALGDNVIEELSIRHIFHDHKDIGGRVYDLVQSNYVWMPALLEDVDLTLDFLGHIKLQDAISVENLNGHVVTCHDICGIYIPSEK